MKNIEILISNQAYFAAMGITRHQALQRQPFNADNLRASLKLCLCAIACVEFIIFDATNFQEYAESVYVISVVITMFGAFISLIVNMKDLFGFIDGWEKCVEQS